MFLADTSVWVDHFRYANPLMVERAGGEVLLMHPLVLGELAMGNLPDRRRLLERLAAMDMALSASDEEVHELVRLHGLHGLGLSWIDACLLTSALITPRVFLWTLDKRLNAVAQRLGRAAQPHH